MPQYKSNYITNNLSHKREALYLQGHRKRYLQTETGSRHLCRCSLSFDTYSNIFVMTKPITSNQTSMKEKIIAGCVLCFGALSLQAENIDIKQFRYAGPYTVQKPFQTAPTNVQSTSFSDKDLLNSELSLDNLSESKTLSGGTLPTSNGYALHLAGFSIDNTHFAKGKIQISGVEHYMLFIDGEIYSKEEIALEPGTHSIIIKCLTLPNAQNTLSVRLESEQDGVFTINEKGKRIYTLRDVLNGRRFSGASLSADGKYLLTNYTITYNDASKENIQCITELNSGRIVTESKNKLQWMPNGHNYYYTRKGSKGKDLISVNPENGQETVLARHIPEGDFQMSPSGEYLLYTLTEEGSKEAQDIYQIIEPDDRQAGWRNRSYLAKYDLHSGLMQRLTFGYHNTYSNCISNDGKEIIFSSGKRRITQRPFYLTSVYKMDINTLKTDTLITDEGYISNCLLSPDKKQLLIVGSGDAFGGIGLNIKPGQISSAFDNQLFLMNLSDNKVKPLTKNFNPSIANVQWDQANGAIYFTANNRDCVNLYRMNSSSGSIHQLNTNEDIVKHFALASNAPKMVYYGESASNANRLYLMDLKKESTTLHEDLNPDLLKDIALGTCQSWDFVNSRGDTICGRFYLPHNFDRTKKYPMIVNYYGGCTPVERSFESRYPHNVYAALGYVVYVLEPSGAIGFGQEFSARHVNAWGDYTADDIIEGTKEFCRTHDFVDSKKIGCIGASYGGFMTQYLQTKTDIFAAAISHAGISNITSYWGEGYWGYSYSEAASADSYPWNNAPLYTEHSPLFHADKIHTPLLFLHGAVDTNVPIGESIQMFTALKMLGRETAFVTVSDQNHQIMDYHKRQKWQNTIFAWFAKWLQNDSTWWNELYPEKTL